jgi:hypothetical protein
VPIVDVAAAGINAATRLDATIAHTQRLITIARLLSYSIVADVGLHNILLEGLLLLPIKEVSWQFAQHRLNELTCDAIVIHLVLINSLQDELMCLLPPGIIKYLKRALLDVIEELCRAAANKEAELLEVLLRRHFTWTWWEEWAWKDAWRRFQRRCGCAWKCRQSVQIASSWNHAYPDAWKRGNPFGSLSTFEGAYLFQFFFFGHLLIKLKTKNYNKK